MSSPVAIKKLLDECYTLKPATLFMGEVQWRYLVRSAIRGNNVLIMGPAGQGKTLAVQSLVSALKRQSTYAYFNLGATQDPRATLIGNTGFSKDSGTFFQESPFVRAITTPDSIILLDELSRAHPDAANILLTVLDKNQRYLRLDEKDGSTVKVAPGVCFIATANVGTEYTNTRAMDRALLDRFTAKIIVDYLTVGEEMELIKLLHPDANMEVMTAVTNIASTTRQYHKEGKLSKCVSTRTVVEMADLSRDGFTLSDLCEIVIYSDYSDDGGLDSERTMVKQIVQQFENGG